jgi:hypothetical protein
VVTPFELGTRFVGRGVPDARMMHRNPGIRFVLETGVRQGLRIQEITELYGC